ncbi:glycerophosphodiester phosphodiesterase [Gilvimarinus chinensis]|uniref:glycerophosphodiester phosphodiesterase n=1 Tax=Gilvimarinus chinensis TaxID=396005 RepID=UPI00037F9E64|nr:glycerophosphodiester phosphodiesterase [Gilvimarinus chinensis]
MLCIAHRGLANTNRPENTLAAVEAALELGVDAIEVDLWYIHGRFWMTHDRIWRGASKSLTGHTKPQLEAIRHRNGEPLAGLDELLNLVQDRCLLNIELKNGGGADQLCKTLTAYSHDTRISLEQIIISSFNHHELNACKHLLPTVKRGMLLASLPLGYGACANDLQPYSINTSINLMSKDFTEDIHKRGYQHWVYTANTREDWDHLHDLEVDGCFTDVADQFKAYLNARTPLSPR